MSGPDAALPPLAEVVPDRLVAALDPVAEVVAAGLAYAAAPSELPDDQPLPGLRLRRVVRAADVEVEVTHHLGADELGRGRVRVDRLPLERAAAAPRRRIHPPVEHALVVRNDPDRDPDTVVAVEDGPDAGTLLLPRTGPTRADREVVVAAARERRFVHLPAPLAGDPALVAGLVLQLVAAGCPVQAVPEACTGLDLLHPQLRSALTEVPPELADDPLVLAEVTARQRLAAWRHHDLDLVWAPTEEGEDLAGIGPRWAPWLRPHRFPAVAVVLVSRRPALLPAAAVMIAAQAGVDVEVVVALHGVPDPAAAVAQTRAVFAEVGLGAEVLAAPVDVPFGAVMDAAVARSDAPMVTKWDDDDLYGPDHLADLLLAQRQTGAALTGKAPEFVYLQASDMTVWRTPGRAEAPSPGLAGGTMLTPRAVLAEIGGWPPVARAIDHHLKTRIAAAGGVVFRTHGFGFVLRRHGLGHTWQVDDERYQRQAVRRFQGLPAVTGLGDAVRFAALPG